MTAGIVSWGVHLPVHRLERAELAQALGTPAGLGARSVACYDEDTTSMGVEAARRALRGATDPGAVYFATTAPAYLDKTNATAIHAAVSLDRRALAIDVAGAIRGGVGALRAAQADRGLAVLSDIRTGRPGSADERDGGDGAAAFLFGEGDAVAAEVLARAAVTAEFLDRWRAPGESASRTWEERFGAGRYAPLVADVVARALADARVERPDHVVVSCAHARVASSVLRRFDGGGPVSRELAGELGFLGAADVGVRLAAVLDRAAPGETVLVVVAADGADALVLRATDAIERRPAARGVAEQLAMTRPVGYQDFLTWRGMLEREPPRRPEPARPAAPPAARAARWKFAFTGGRCEACGTMHVPPQRVCVECGTLDRMRAEPMAGRRARIATFTVDRLAYSLAPPAIDAVVDFEGGGRYACQMTEVAPDDIRVGAPVEMTFRRLYSAQGVHNYFWKARPA